MTLTISKLVKLESLNERGLSEIYEILHNSNSLDTKRHAISIIKKLGNQGSIEHLIREFKYKGRWWVRWWDYEERYDVEAYHSYVASSLADIVMDNNEIKIIYNHLNSKDENIRYWMLYTLTCTDNIDWKKIKKIAKNDLSEKVREFALLMLEYKKKKILSYKKWAESLFVI